MPSIIENKELLTRFIKEVWSEGNIEASDRYLGATYTVHHSRIIGHWQITDRLGVFQQLCGTV